jgi:NTP pyrophosphatase (non-canonical NTP hydrolase)
MLNGTTKTKPHDKSRTELAIMQEEAGEVTKAVLHYPKVQGTDATN